MSAFVDIPVKVLYATQDVAQNYLDMTIENLKEGILRACGFQTVNCRICRACKNEKANDDNILGVCANCLYSLLDWDYISRRKGFKPPCFSTPYFGEMAYLDELSELDCPKKFEKLISVIHKRGQWILDTIAYYRMIQKGKLDSDIIFCGCGESDCSNIRLIIKKECDLSIFNVYKIDRNRVLYTYSIEANWRKIKTLSKLRAFYILAMMRRLS